MLEFYRGKRIFITGNTGFKGSWLSMVLLLAGAEVTGFALPPEEPGLYGILGLQRQMRAVYGDIRDFEALQKAFRIAEPEIVFHLAAQPIVRRGYRDPVGTYQTNVMGTVHLLECVRQSGGAKSVLNVTTDKVYENREWPWGYRETDPLNGADPYSNSKSCAELVTAGYWKSYLKDGNTAVSTARAGNVIGGGDFSADRLVPDCVRALQSGTPLRLRNPGSVRPYQHVLEALSAYLLIAQRQYEDRRLAGSYNIGPDAADCLTAAELAELFCQSWGPPARWESDGTPGPHEDAVLRLDCSKIRSRLGWRPKWTAAQAVAQTAAWTKAWFLGEHMAAFTERQAADFFVERG